METNFIECDLVPETSTLKEVLANPFGRRQIEKITFNADQLTSQVIQFGTYIDPTEQYPMGVDGYDTVGPFLRVRPNFIFVTTLDHSNSSYFGYKVGIVYPDELPSKGHIKIYQENGNIVIEFIKKKHQGEELAIIRRGEIKARIIGEIVLVVKLAN